MEEVEAAAGAAAGVAALTSEGLQGSRPRPQRSATKTCPVFDRGGQRGGVRLHTEALRNRRMDEQRNRSRLKKRHPALLSPECLYLGFGCPRASSVRSSGADEGRPRC